MAGRAIYKTISTNIKCNGKANWPAFSIANTVNDQIRTTNLSYKVTKPSKVYNSLVNCAPAQSVIEQTRQLCHRLVSCAKGLSAVLQSHPMCYSLVSCATTQSDVLQPHQLCLVMHFGTAFVQLYLPMGINNSLLHHFRDVTMPESYQF